VKKIIFTISLFISSLVFSRSRTVPPTIISTIPSITEMVYYLGAQSQLIGVTPFCKFPKEAQKITKIGSSFSLNIEKIVSLKPGVVLLAPTKGGKNQRLLKKLGIRYEVIPYERLEDVETGLRKINNSLMLGRSDKIEDFKKSLMIKSLKNKKVLIVIGEDIRSGQLRSVRVAGKKTFYGDILTQLGATNAYGQDGASYPKLDLERIMKLKFDYIIRIGGESPLNKELVNKWKTTSYSNRVKFIFADYAVVPGPRIGKLLKDVMEVINAKN